MESVLIVCNGAKHYGLESSVSHENTLFADGEVSVRIKDSVRNKRVTILQGFELPNTHLMELIITIDAARRSGAGEVNVIIPMFPYARQDRRHASGTPISGRVVCDLLVAVNPDRVICFDLHADQIQGFMGNRCQFDHIPLTSFLSFHLKQHIADIQDYVFCAPDAGSIKRTLKLKDACGATDMCFINKVRTRANVVDSMQIIGDVKGRNILIIDDMIDTAGTLVCAMQHLYDNGAIRVKAVASHGLFSSPAYERLKNSQLYITDSMPINDKDTQGTASPEYLSVLPLKNFILDILTCINNQRQLGKMFKSWSE